MTQLMEKFLKIVSVLPMNYTYCYDLSIVSTILSMLRYILKPRYEE